MSALHAESLLRIPLLRWLLERSGIAIAPRPVDAAWHYRGVFSICPVGFDPFGSCVYFAGRSRLQEWLPHATGSARPYNDGEWLVDEALSMVHDGLHLLAVSELVADLFEGAAPAAVLTEANVDDVVFTYVVSEAAATVGLDYWYLARTSLDEVCPIGTRFRGLTSSYREDDLETYRRFCPSLLVQEPAFLEWMVEGYCAHAFAGFSVSDVRACAPLRRWLGHELRMSRSQLRLIRQWIRHRTGIESSPTVDFSSPRRRAAVRRLAVRLFRLAQGELSPVLGPARVGFPERSERARHDYRFTNVSALPAGSLDDASSAELDTRQFAFLAMQHLSALEWRDEERHGADAIRSFILARDHRALRDALNGGRRVAAHPGPIDLLFVD